MMAFMFSSRSREALKGVHPDLILVVSRGLLYSQYDFMVTEGFRTMERQKELKAAGYSRTLNSQHLKQADGFAHAFDVMAVGDLDQDGYVDAQDPELTWNPKIYSEIARAMKCAACELGISIRWGGDFKTRDGEPWFDGPHFQLD